MPYTTTAHPVERIATHLPTRPTTMRDPQKKTSSPVEHPATLVLEKHEKVRPKKRSLVLFA